MQVHVRGSLSEFWGITLFPFVLWSSYMLLKKKEKRYYLLFSLSVFFLLITHNLLPLIFFPILVLWIAYWTILQGEKKNLKKLPFSFLTGVGLSAFFTVPLVLEKKFIHAETLLSGYFDYRRHFVDLKQMFLSNNFGYGSSDLGAGDDLALSSGRALLLAGLLGIVYAFVKFRKERKTSIFILFTSLVELAVLFMMHLKSSFVWENLTILQWLQFPWRFLAISILLLSLIGGALIALGGRYKYFLAIVLITLAFYWHGSFFEPKSWQSVGDEDKFSGELWERQLTVSIGDYLPVSAVFPPNKKAPDLPEILDGNVDIRDFKKGSYFQTMRVDSPGVSTIRVPFYDFPGVVVVVDGVNVSHGSDDCRFQDYCFGLVSFKVNEGLHDVKVVLRNTPVRSFANAISLMSLIGLIAYFNYGKIEKIFR